MLEELEEVLILCDMGVPTAEAVIGELRLRVKENKIREPLEVREALAEIVGKLLEEPPGRRPSRRCFSSWG